MNLRVSALLPLMRLRMLMSMLILMLTTAACHADAAGLMLSIGERFTDDGSSCLLPLKAGEPATAPAYPLAISEDNVVGWTGGRIVLEAAQFPPGHAERLIDRCFVLAVNGRHVGSGLVLSVSSPRLTAYPTLNIINQGLWLALQFTSGNHRNISSLYYPELSEALNTRIKPRIRLWTGQLIGTTDASQCAATTGLPALKPGLVDTDIVAWSRERNTMTIHTGRFGGVNRLQTDLVDRCFVLAVEGQAPVSGVILSAHSARLVDFPALVVAPEGKHLALQLRPALPAYGKALLADALDRVLQGRPSQAMDR